MKKRITLILILLIITGLFSGCKNLLSLYTEAKPEGLETKGMFVAVGANGTIHYSKDGINWSSDAGPGGNDLYGIGFGNNKYIAVEVDGTISYSDDGKNWIAISPDAAGNLHNVTYGKGKYVACGEDGAGNGGIYYSNDGMNWSDPLSISTSTPLRGIFYGGEKFVTVGPGGAVHYSSDGKNWSGNVGPGGTDLYDVSYGLGKFVVVGSDAMGMNGEINYSKDLINWTNVGPNSCFYGVCYGDGKFIAVGKDGLIHYSSDGINWSGDVGPGGGDNFRSVVYGNKRFVTVGQNGTIYYSHDGINWHVSNSPTSEYLYRLTFTKYNIEYP